MRALRTIGVAVAAAGVVAGCTVGHLWAPTDEEVLAQILPSAVQVVLEQQEGRRFRSASGVVIATRAPRQCFVLTAGHTFAGFAKGKGVFVLLDSHAGAGTKLPASVLAEHNTDRSDLALLKIETDRCVPARVERRATLGEWAWVIAYPWGRQLTVARGVVSQVDGADESRLMVDASVSYGVSGAGVYQARTGTLIGVVEGYSTARVSAQGTGTPWYIDVPMPGQTLVTSLRRVRRFLDDTGHGALLADSIR